MHGHMAFWGAYAMIVLAIIAYALPLLTGRGCHDTPLASFAFWTSNIGMICMTLAFAVAGVTQVYLERRRSAWTSSRCRRRSRCTSSGSSLAATLFTLGIIAYVCNFIRYGMPVGEVLRRRGARRPPNERRGPAAGEAVA
jgi:nitric oxide reductase subunit B